MLFFNRMFICLFVSLSVTFVDHVKTNKHIFEIFSPSVSHIILVFLYQTGWRHSDGNPPNGGVKFRWGISTVNVLPAKLSVAECQDADDSCWMCNRPGVALGEACSIVLRGATQQILDEAERSLHDALCVMSQTVKETRTVFGGGQSL